MMGRWRSRSNHEGFALVVSVTWLFVSVILISAMVYVARITLEMRTRTLADLHAYVMGHSVVDAIRHSPTIASRPCGTMTLRNLDGWALSCRSFPTGVNRTIQVKVDNGTVENTISFTYDTIAHRITAWQDNSPGF